jgi:hypothetical protein
VFFEQNLSVLCGKTRKYGKFITKSARHPVLNTAQDFIDKRKVEMPEDSYTTSLFQKGHLQKRKPLRSSEK